MYSQSIQITYQLPELIMGISFLTESFLFALKQVHYVMLPVASSGKLKAPTARSKCIIDS